MTVYTETILMLIEQYLSKYYAESSEEEETPILVFEDEEHFLDFSIEFNEMLINLAEFDNFGGGSFTNSLRSDAAVLLLFFCDEGGTHVFSKDFLISY